MTHNERTPNERTVPTFLERWQQVDRLMLEMASLVAPWLAPVASAWLVGERTYTVLGLPWPVAAVFGLAVELLTIGTINRALILWTWNRTRRTNEPTAPLGLAVALVVGCLGITVGLTVLLVVIPGLATWALTVFPLLAVIGGMNLALRADHAQRLVETAQLRQAAQEARVLAKQARQMAKAAAPEMPKVVPEAPEIAPVVPVVTRGTYATFQVVQAERNGAGLLTASEIVSQFGVPKRTAYHWLAKYQKQQEGA